MQHDNYQRTSRKQDSIGTEQQADERGLNNDSTKTNRKHDVNKIQTHAEQIYSDHVRPVAT
jgi:hypothetical protein